MQVNFSNLISGLKNFKLKNFTKHDFKNSSNNVWEVYLIT